MSITFEVVRTDRPHEPLQDRESTVRVIGELLPFVLGKYGIGPADVRVNVPLDAIALHCTVQ